MVWTNICDDNQGAHCLTGESYFDRRGCLVNNLTLARIVGPIDSWNMSRCLREYLTHSKIIRQVLLPNHLRESEGHRPEAWFRGWPLVTAKRADSPSVEG